MWTAPKHRKLGIGRLLVNEVLNWARGRNARELQLMVTSNNEPAIRFYQRLGFTETGRTEPYPKLSSNTRCRDRFHKGLRSRHCTMWFVHAMPLFLCDPESIAKGLVNVRALPDARSGGAVKVGR